MEISSLLSAFAAHEQLPIDVGTAVLDMNLEQLDTMSDGMKKMMEMSVTPHIGSNVDISV